jgi:hypothetical protein
MDRSQSPARERWHVAAGPTASSSLGPRHWLSRPQEGADHH